MWQVSQTKATHTSQTGLNNLIAMCQSFSCNEFANFIYELDMIVVFIHIGIYELKVYVRGNVTDLIKCSTRGTKMLNRAFTACTLFCTLICTRRYAPT